MHILNNWKVLKLAAEDGKQLICIEGRVHGSNPRFQGSSLIRTSYVTCYQMNASSMVITTAHGSEYLLGKPDPSEQCTEQFLMDCLPEKKQAPPAPFDGVHTQVMPSARDDKY